MYLKVLRKIFALAALLASSTACAKMLYVFDNPRLIAVNNSEGVTGYYGATDQVTRYSCSFFLNEKGFSAEWIVQTDEQHDGCGGAIGDFRKGRDDEPPTRFTVVGYLPALGIRRVVNTGAVVVALKTRGLRTYVRHVHPATGRVTTSWIETGKLENPFSLQPDALSRQVKYTVHPVTRFNGRRLGKNVSIELVQLVSGPGLSSTREEFRAGISSYKDLIHVNDNLAEALINDNADILGDCGERCEWDIRNKSYRTWMEDGQMVFFPEFLQASYINQQEYFIKVTR